MEAHEHRHINNEEHDSWLNRHRWIGYLALAAIAYYLIVEHRVHVVSFLPFLFLAACPLMHLFMHGGHHQKHDHKNQGQEKKS